MAMNGGYAGEQCASQESQATILCRNYLDAKLAYDNACREFTSAAMAREQASKMLADLSAKMAGMIEQGMADPSVPVASAPNGIIGGSIGPGMPMQPRY